MNNTQNTEIKALNDLLNSYNFKAIDRLFSEVSSCLTSADRIDELIDEITNLSVFVSMPVAQHHLYRARPITENDKFPQYLHELLEPPSHLTKMNRCNIENDPVLYVTTHPVALISECHLSRGDFYILLQFDRHLRTTDLQCLLLGLDYNIHFQNDPSIFSIDSYWKSALKSNFDKIKHIDKKIHQLFVLDTNDNKFAYRFTSNLCYNRFSKIRDLDAICYPSIANRGAVQNLAIRKGSVSKTYIPVKAGLIQILDDWSLRILKTATVDNQDLKWGDKINFDLPKAVGLRSIDPDDERLYIHPHKK
jgi:hypothetical protein